MKRRLALLLTILILFGLMANTVFACNAGRVGFSGAPLKRQIVLRIRAMGVPRQAMRLLTHSVKQSARFAAHMPRHIRRQLQSGSIKAQVAFHAATGQTQSSFHRISAGVTSLSLQLLRGAFSYIWALLSGLLR